MTDVFRNPPAPRTRLDTRHLTRHAHKAIRDRLRYPAPDALLAAERDGRDVILRLNSGGNSIAVETWLRLRGYQARYDGGNPGGYGCAVRVSPAGTLPPEDSVAAPAARGEN